MDKESVNRSGLERRKKRQHAFVLGLSFFAVCVVFTISLESRDQVNWSELSAPSKQSCVAPIPDETPPFYPWAYARMWGWLSSNSNDSSSQVAEVAIEGDLKNTQGNLCRGRLYLADLIRAAVQQQPKVIVIDKYFSPDACALNDKPTDEFEKAIGLARIPVILGEATDLASAETEESCLVQKPQLDLVPANVFHGLLRLNVNKEQIPLRWQVLPRQPPHTGPTTAKPSLSLVAASIFAPKEERNFRSLQSGTRQPYARVFSALPAETSTALLCSTGTTESRNRWSANCTPNTQTVDLRNKVVVIGSESEVDHWNVLGTPMYGFQLQAVYIDALLSHHYLRASSTDLYLLLFLGYLLGLEGIPVLAKYLYYRDRRHVPYIVREHFPWVCLFSFVFLLSIFVCFIFGYLPPWKVLLGILVAFVTRVAILGSEYGEKLIVGEENEPHR